MSERKVTYCNECDAERKDINHWFSAFGPVVSPSFSTFDNARDNGDFIRADYCGQQCAIAAFQRFLNTGSIEKIDTAK